MNNIIKVCIKVILKFFSMCLANSCSVTRSALTPIYEMFPNLTAGSSKRRQCGGYRSASKKLAHELDNGIVPLPAKHCFVCNK